MAQRYPLADQKVMFDEQTEPLRWFMLPSEAQDLLLGNSHNVKQNVPFDPVRYSGAKGDPLEVNIANMFLNEKDKVNKTESDNKKSKKSTETKNVAVNFSNEPTHISNSSVNDVNFSNALNQIFNPTPKTQTNNLVPNIANHLLPERQNSFSSEISNSDYQSDVNYYQPNYVNAAPYVNCNSPLKNSFDNFCYSPQPPTSSPIPNQVDYNSQMIIQQPNYISMQNGYVNQPNSVVANECNNYNYSYMDQSQVIGSYCGDSAKNESPQIVNKVHFAIGPNDVLTRQRCNSVGSSLILGPKSRASLGVSYSRSLTDGETSLNLSECSLSSNEDIHAYVTEVTKELATEIKSEIREVISKVEDVLSESADTENGNNHLEHRGSRSDARLIMNDKLERTNSLPSVSANDIAEYLMGVSKEMAEEMKSEIRELVSSVVSAESSPMPDKKKRVTIETDEKKEKDVKRKNGITKFDNENISQSRDSGINLSYSETINKEKEAADEKSENSEKSSNNSEESKRDRSESLDSFQENERLRNRSESLDSLQGNDESDQAAKVQLPKRKISRASKKAEKCLGMNQCSEESSNDEGMNVDGVPKPRWHCPSKAVWKPTVEVSMGSLIL